MFTTSRRDVILSAAMAGAALRGQPLLDRVIADETMICGLGKLASDGAGYALTVHGA